MPCNCASSETKMPSMYSVQAQKALYPGLGFIHINFRLRQHLFHGREIALPVGSGNKSMCFAIGV